MLALSACPEECAFSLRSLLYRSVRPSPGFAHSASVWLPCRFASGSREGVSDVIGSR